MVDSLNVILIINILIITNSGLPLTINPEDLFRRFHKGSDNPQSVGLGLSIVKKITDSYGMIITYTCQDSIHEIKLRYNVTGQIIRHLR